MRVLDALIHIITIGAAAAASAPKPDAVAHNPSISASSTQGHSNWGGRTTAAAFVRASPRTHWRWAMCLFALLRMRGGALRSHRCAGAAMRWNRGVRTAAGAGGQRFWPSSSVSSVLQAASYRGISKPAARLTSVRSHSPISRAQARIRTRQPTGQPRFEEKLLQLRSDG